MTDAALSSRAPTQDAHCPPAGENCVALSGSFDFSVLRKLADEWEARAALTHPKATQGEK